jgi:hypothetical protein
MLTNQEISLLVRCKEWDISVGWNPSLSANDCIIIQSLVKRGFLDDMWIITFAGEMALAIVPKDE